MFFLSFHDITLRVVSSIILHAASVDTLVDYYTVLMVSGMWRAGVRSTTKNYGFRTLYDGRENFIPGWLVCHGRDYHVEFYLSHTKYWS
jgi:hypothetical protein